MDLDGTKGNHLRSSSGQETESEVTSTSSCTTNCDLSNNANNGSIYPDSSYPVSIDLTGPLPVISVMRDQKYLINPHYNPQNNNQNQSYSSEKLYHKLIREAPKIPLRPDLKYSDQDDGSKTEIDTSDIDADLLSEGKKFIRRNFFAIIFAHLVSIAFLLGVKPIQALLLRTGSIHNKENTLKKYLACILTLKNLYECDFSNKSSKTNLELKFLRKGEEKVAKNFRIFAPPPIHCMKLDMDEETLLQALKQDLSLLTEVDTSNVKNLNKIYTTVNPDVPMSQYDLAIVQFTFFGFVSLFPKIFGIHETEKSQPEGLRGFIHIWAIVGKRLGLDDKFNLCLKKNFDPETNLNILKDIFLLSFKISDGTLIKLWKSMMCGSSRYFYFFRTKSMLHFMLKNVAGLVSSNTSNCKNVFSLMNFFERMSYYFHLFILNWMLRFWLTRTLMNLCSKAVFYLGYKLYLRRIKKHKYIYDTSLVNIYVIDESSKTSEK